MSEAQEPVPIEVDDQDITEEQDYEYTPENAQVSQEESEFTNRSNIMKGDRLRHSKPQSGNQYNEGPGEEEIPEV